jgi:hypothetical protein
MTRTLNLYLCCKGAVIAFGFSFYKIGAVLFLAGILNLPLISLILVPLGCRELVELYAFCGFRYCDSLRRLVLSWIVNVLIATPIYAALLWYVHGIANIKTNQELRVPMQTALSSNSTAVEGALSRRERRLGAASWSRVARFLLAWLIGIDVRMLVCSINFFTRDEELRWIEHIGKRAVPESVIVPQGFGRQLNTGEILLEVAQSLYGLPFSS